MRLKRVCVFTLIVVFAGLICDKSARALDVSVQLQNLIGDPNQFVLSKDVRQSYALAVTIPGHISTTLLHPNNVILGMVQNMPVSILTDGLFAKLSPENRHVEFTKAKYPSFELTLKEGSIEFAFDGMADKPAINVDFRSMIFFKS